MSLKTINFIVHGEPFGKQRPKFHSGYIAYTPQKTLDYEEYVQSEYMLQVRGDMIPEDSLFEVIVDAYFGIPDSTPKWKIPLMEAKIMRPFKKPDWDNIGKVITDALNAIAYHDDAYVVTGAVNKYYSENPRVEVVLRELNCLTPKATKKDLVDYYEKFENLKEQKTQSD